MGVGVKKILGGDKKNRHQHNIPFYIYIRYLFQMFKAPPSLGPRHAMSDLHTVPYKTLIGSKM